MLALAYSSKFPGDVESICLVGAPAGIFPWSADMTKRLDVNLNPFIPLTADDFDFEMKCLFMNPPTLTGDYIDKAVREYSQNKSRYVSIFNIVSVSMYNFSTRPLMQLKCPAIMILGQEEDVFNTENAGGILKSKLPGCRLIIVQNAGHLPMLEQPEKTASLYINFLKSIHR